MRRLLLASLPLAFSQTLILEPPSYQEKIRGVYENKIRQNAAPEKVFETFASVKEGKRFFMTPNDFFHAIIPFNYSHAIEKLAFNPSESLIIRAIDANKDGRISFPEYFFFIVLLSTSNNYFKDLIKKREGKLDCNQFIEVLLEAKKNSPQGKKIVGSNKLDPRSTTISEEDFKESCLNLFDELFKHNKEITWHDFRDMKDLISEELLKYEFYRFASEDDTISIEDFGKSIVAYMPTSMIEMYLSRLESLGIQGKVTLQEYLAFMFVMQESNLIHQKLLLEHMEHGELERSHITKVLVDICKNSRFCHKNALKITDVQIEMFFRLLDLDDSNSLDPEEIFNLVSSRGTQGTSQSMNPDFSEVVNEFKKFMNAFLKFSGITPVFKVKEEKLSH